jgi:outer membrane receptor protein involved in Fe transport
MRRIRCLLFLLIVILTCVAFGQVGSDASLLGVVTDASGAVVPKANVVVVNLDTGLQRTAISGDSGEFEVLSLPAGPYSVTVTTPGFSTWKLPRIDLTVASRQRVSPVLKVGDVTEQIDVQAVAELVQTDRSSVATVVEEKQIRELPLNGRNPVQLVSLAPGMRFLGRSGPERGSSVQGVGGRDDATEFQLDGLNANAGMDERGMAIPNVDTIAEFSVETNSFSAEQGRNPLQVLMLTKSGTNAFHGTAWEFLRNEKLDAFNTFAKLPGARKPKLSRNQFGATLGGPILRNKTFFFASFEGTTIRQARIYNSNTVLPEMLQGDFSSVATPIRDPLTGQPFAGNRIPADRISAASRFFFPHILLPNAPNGQFRTTAPVPEDTWEGTGRIDHIFTDRQRIYGRWIVYDNTQQSPDYRPEVVQSNNTRQHNVALNYTYSPAPTWIINLGANYMNSFNRFSSPVVGIDNLTQQAGIQGFGTDGRAGSTGLPSVGITGYTGFNAPWGNPGRLWMEAKNAKATTSLIRGKHTMNLGYEINDRTTFGQHASFAARGNFSFNGQYTGNGFADYLLGYTSAGGRNFPLQTFGMKHSPYSAIYFQDAWKPTANLTLNLGLRYDRWHAKRAVRGNVTSFDPATGRAIAGEDKNGQVDLTAQPVARFVAAATQGLWVPASEIGAPPGLFEPNGFVSPRIGVAWRPGQNDTFVIRGGYGIFPSSFIGNITASAIVGPPFWNYENPAYTAQSLQRWETAFSNDPTVFLSPGVSAAAYNVDNQKAHEWNISIQRALPGNSAVTVSYVGNRILDVIGANLRNEVAPGQYTNLQAARPFPRFAGITLYENLGKTWYNALQFKFERRFSAGLLFNTVYSFGKHLVDGVGSAVWDAPEPFAPEGYNRGRSAFDRKHILNINGVYELPFGKGRRYLTDSNPFVNGVLGGWQLSGVYAFTSGGPLSIGVPGATLGNGRGTRANVVGDPRLSDGTADRWFDTAAFAAPPARQFGNSAIGILDGPGSHVLDTGLMKNFYVTESKYVQFRWEMFNAPNHVNLSNPGTTLATPTFGRILGAGAARQMQLALKFVY